MIPDTDYWNMFHTVR